MFGYIRPCKPELKVCELNAYNAVYCGFCRSLGKAGALLKFTLSYDLTFFSLLSLAVSEGFCGFDSCRCPAKLFRRKTCVKNCPQLKCAADLAVLLLWGKILDDTQDGDGRKISNLLLRLYLSPKYKKAAARQSSFAKAIDRYLSAQTEAEKQQSLDGCCDPTAQLLSEVFGSLSEDNDQKEKLSRLGYVTGRWVYLIDAADDLERDIKKGSFNPLICTGESISGIKKGAEQSLNMCICEAEDIISETELYHFRPIIENIIYLGLKNTQNAVLHSKDKKERKLALNGKSI